MSIARQSIVHPKAGMNERVGVVLDELEANYAQLPGYILGFRYQPVGIQGVMGRIAIWRTHQDADNASGNTHIQAIRARLNALIQGEHEEHVLEIEGTPQKLSQG